MMVESLLQRLKVNATKYADKEALSYLESGPNGGNLGKTYTFAGIAEETDALAINLLDSGLKRGEFAVLVFLPSLDFIIVFLACLKAGIVAVPVFPPHPTRKDTLAMFSKIVRASGATYALTSTSYSHIKKMSSLKEAFTKLGRGKSNGQHQDSWPDNLTWIVTDTLRKSNANKTKSLVPPKSSDLAFLQFTSGSTSDPKGVMVNHSNLADNLTKITTELQAGRNTVVVSWLPQYHDMGLIGSYLGILYCGGRGYYMSPLTYLARPAMWIEAVSRFGGTHLQAPNFAFKLTARKFQKDHYVAASSGSKGINSIDLSSVRHVINAAEPVTEDSMEAFYDVFCSFGLKRGVIYPTYGLAEHTVFVCSGGTQRLTVSKHALEVDGVVTIVTSGGDGNNDKDDGTTSTMIGCGYPAKQSVDVQIVSTETFASLVEDEVGEIWVRSDSKAAGYYKKEEQSKREFGAMLADAGSKGEVGTLGGYLRTGDLGFLHNGELFICGRIKDLIIVGGRNYYPQDIEATAEASDSVRIRPGCSAAFTVDPISGSDEQIALVLELREVPDAKNLEAECAQLIDSLRALINQEHSLSLSHILLLHPKSIPKTTSGKISRASCRKAFLKNTLKVIRGTTFETHKGKFEIHQDNPAGETSLPRENVDPETIRSMEKSEILIKLKTDVSRIVSMPLSALPLDSDLATMMDSLSLSQFKGILDSQYATKLSDEYLFREGSNLNKLAEIVKLGYAPDDDIHGSPGGTDARDPGGSKNKGAMVNTGPKSCAERLGCPPGVVCVIQ